MTRRWPELRLEDGLSAQIQQRMDEERLSFAALVRKAITEYLADPAAPVASRRTRKGPLQRELDAALRAATWLLPADRAMTALAQALARDLDASPSAASARVMGATLHALRLTPESRNVEVREPTPETADPIAQLRLRRALRISAAARAPRGPG